MYVTHRSRKCREATRKHNAGRAQLVIRRLLLKGTRQVLAHVKAQEIHSEDRRDAEKRRKHALVQALLFYETESIN
jgi:hypothetical protein